MWYKPYGSTGKQVSVIGFGGMRFPKPDDLDAMAEVVLHAHQRGINYFDTAPHYCNDKSEAIMGRAFRAMPRDSFYCSSKCGSARGDEFRQSLERSLDRLGVNTIDFFHVWCLLKPEQLAQRVAGGAIGAALRAREEGLIRHVVVSAHLDGPNIQRVLEAGYFEGITLGYNVLNFPFRAQGLAAAEKLHLGVATMNPLGGGMIPKQADRLSFLKGPNDKNVVEAAIRFNVSHSAVTLALVGMGSKEEVDAAVDAVKDFQPYTAEHIEKIKAHISKEFDGFCTGCGYCMPCPANLSIPQLMDAYNQKILSGNGDGKAVANRLKWQWGLSPELAADCLQCGKCEEACTQHLNIRERLEYIAGLAGKG